MECGQDIAYQPVSIHASVKDATMSDAIEFSVFMFQSTRP